MATVGLSVGLGLIPVVGPILSVAGAALGSYIDSAFLLPGLFPPEDIVGPRLNEIRVQFNEEGAPHNFALGTENRTAGLIIWMGDLIETKKTKTVGGKGGGAGQKTVNYDYFVDIAICFAKTDGLTAQVEQILADGKKVYERNPAIGYAGTVTAVATVLLQQGTSIWDLSSTSFGLETLLPGRDAVVTGFAGGSNNGTFMVVSSSKNTATGTSFARLQNTAGTSEGPVAVTITQTLVSFQPGDMAGIENYSGSLAQTASPTIEAREGAGEVPAYRGFAYTVLKRFALKKFGNRIPLFNIIFNGGASTAVSSMFTSIAERGGLSSSFFNVTDLAGLTARGYIINGIVDMAKALQPLAIAYDIIDQEQGEGIRLFQRKNATIVDVDPADLHVIQAGNEQSRKDYPISVVDTPELPFPESISLKYLDYQNALQNGTERERALRGGSDRSELTISIPIVLYRGAAEAREIIKRVIYSAFINRQTVTFTLPLKYSHIQENDVVRFDSLDNTWNLLVKRADRGGNFILKFEAQVEVRAALIQSATAEDPTTTVGFYEPPLPFFAPIEPTFGGSGAPAPGPGPGQGGPVPSSGDVPEVHFPVTLWDDEEFWPGASIFVSDEEDGEYQLLGLVTEEAIQGFTRSALGDIPNAVRLDTLNTVDVEILTGELESVGTIAAAVRFNLCRIGNEVLAFMTATLTSTKRYTLSNLIRGLAETRGEMGSHSNYETFAVISDSGYGAGVMPVPHSWLGAPKWVKCLVAGQSIDDVAPVAMTIEHGGMKPRQVVNPKWNRVDPTGEITLRWNRVARAASRPFGPGSAPMLEQEEEYEIDFLYPPSSSTVVATVSVSEPSRYFTAVEVGTYAFDIFIYQINSAMGGTGRGRASDRIQFPGV